MGALISHLALFLKNSSTLQFTAFKVLLFFIFVQVLPIILFNFLLGYQSEIGQYTQGKMAQLLQGVTGSGQPLAFHFEGVAAWVANQLRIPDAMNYIISAASTRLTIDFILRPKS